MAHLPEATVEEAALAWLEAIGWQIAPGPDISPAGATLTLTLSQRESYAAVVLSQRLCDALARLNPALPAEALADRLPQADAARRRGPAPAQPGATPPARRWRDGGGPRP